MPKKKTHYSYKVKGKTYKTPKPYEVGHALTMGVLGSLGAKDKKKVRKKKSKKK